MCVLTEEKPMPTDGVEGGGGVIDRPACLPFTRLAANRGLGVYHLVNAGTRTLCLGIWKCMSNFAIRRVCMMRIFVPKCL